MSDSVSIKVNIAGKEYPLKVSSAEEQDVKAVELEIKDKLKMLQADYGVKDKQDLLAMSLLQYMMANKKSNTDSEVVSSSLHDKIKILEEYVSDYLNS
ncbi:MAG: cell division protein ZapA [Flavobacteriales bacterium]|nr:cell division protein ZapA [Flavobacteriales bacterium]|tara:strand:+ start:269 stop:562 length:294 start_codon:yes stop_codon:yes gene_type:complete